MKIEITEELLSSVLAQIRQKPLCTSGSLKGIEAANLLALRELRRRGLITGVFMNDNRQDQHGPLLYDATRLEAL